MQTIRSADLLSTTELAASASSKRGIAGLGRFGAAISGLTQLWPPLRPLARLSRFNRRGLVHLPAGLTTRREVDAWASKGLTEAPRAWVCPGRRRALQGWL